MSTPSEKTDDEVDDVRTSGNDSVRPHDPDESPEGKTFPCEQCGADVVFHIGAQRLKCPYCAFEKNIEFEEGDAVEEQDFEAMILRMRELRDNNVESKQESGLSEIQCEACGGTVVFQGTLTSTECPYCATPVQLENVHDAEHRVPVDGVLPFQIDEKKARANLNCLGFVPLVCPQQFQKERGERKVLRSLSSVLDLRCVDGQSLFWPKGRKLHGYRRHG